MTTEQRGACHHCGVLKSQPHLLGCPNDDAPKSSNQAADQCANCKQPYARDQDGGCCDYPTKVKTNSSQRENPATLTSKNDLGFPPCMLPPLGWVCLGESGHEGPCAAMPIRQEDVAAQMQRLRDCLKASHLAYAKVCRETSAIRHREPPHCSTCYCGEYIDLPQDDSPSETSVPLCRCNEPNHADDCPADPEQCRNWRASSARCLCECYAEKTAVPPRGKTSYEFPNIDEEASEKP